MNKKIYTVLGIIAVVVIVIAIAKNSQKTPNISLTNSPIKIGAILSLTGDAAPWGEYAKNGINLAVKNINDNGGIDGRLVQVVIEDDHTDPKQGVSAWNKLTTIDHVQGVIGGVFDFTAQPLIPLAHEAKIAYISPSNFRIAGGFDLNDQSFVMLTDFSTVIRALKNELNQSSVKKLAVVHFKSTFGNEIAKTLGTVMNELGKRNIIDESYGQIGNNDFKTLIIKLKQENVDTVFLDAVANDPLIFFKQSRDLNFHPQIITYNGALDAFQTESEKSLTKNSLILNWEVTSSEFNTLYQAAYGAPATKSADKNFDAVYVLSNAIAHSDSTANVAVYIESHSVKTPNANISFTPNHTVDHVNVEVQTIK
jgi:branched-chain amino acid transport system substrate-binding protein